MRLQTQSALAEVLAKAKDISIIVPPTAEVETITSALALYLQLKQGNSLVKLYYFGQFYDVLDKLAGGDEIITTLPCLSLDISIDLRNSTIQTPKFFIEKGRLHFLIRAKKGILKANNFKFETEEIETDLVIVIGARAPEEIGDFYHVLVKPKKNVVVNIDNHSENQYFGQINIVDETATGVSQIVFYLLGELKFKPTLQSSKALLFGLGLCDTTGKEAGWKAPFVSKESSLLPPKIFSTGK